MAGVLDKFIQIIEENDLRPEDIEVVKVQPHPAGQFKFASNNSLRTPEDYCFNAPYLISCAAQSIKPAYWHDLNIRNDKKIMEYMKKLNLIPIIDEEDFALAKRKDPRTYQQRIEVVAKGKSYKKKAPHPKGAWYTEELKNTDEELIEKFTDNASRILSSDKAEKASGAIFELEKFNNLADLMALVAP